MIVNELYPSLADKAQGFDITDYIENLDYGTNADHPLRPYTMGYINYEDCPDFINLSEVISTFEQGGENSIKFQPATEAANHAWGYCARKVSDFYTYSTQPFNIIKDENDIWRAKGSPAHSANYSNICLVNGGYLATYSLYNKFNLTLSISITIDEGNLKPNGFTSNGGITTVSEFLDFCSGDRALTFTYNQHEYEINISDFDLNGYVVLRDIDDTLSFVVGITNFYFTDTGTGSGASGSYLAIMPWIEMEIDDQTYYTYCSGTGAGSSGQYDFRLYTNWGSAPMAIGNVGQIGGKYQLFNLTGEITYEQTQTWATSYSTEMIHYVPELNCFRSYTGNSQATGYQWRIMPIIKPFKIKTLLALRLKRFTGTEAALVPPANQYYTTDVDTNKYNTSDVPTFDILSGDYTDIEGELRPWQMWEVDITENNFDPSDIPPYRPTPPPGPTPQETEPKYPGHPTLGSATRYVPTAGVNFYALNSSLVSSFVQRLWSQPKNFYEAIQIAGNQVDSIFDYIQSFRYYPLNYDFSTSNVYPVIFGTGAVLKDSDGDTNFQLSEAAPIQETIAAGDWDLSDPIYHWRNNFLDYSPYLKMSIYLPFAGTIELSPEAVASNTDISAATITLLASFDIETGTITYYVINQANVILAQKTAKIAIDLPLSGNNAAEQSAAILRAQFSTVKQLLGTGASAVSGAAMGAATAGPVGAGISLASTAASTLGSLGDMYLQNSLAHKAVPVEIQGMGGAFSALAGGQYPYITINRQKVSNPPNYAHTTGYLVEGTYRISSLSGLTVCRNVDITGITQATDKEKAQIKQILESGFYA